MRLLRHKTRHASEKNSLVAFLPGEAGFSACLSTGRIMNDDIDTREKRAARLAFHSTRIQVSFSKIPMNQVTLVLNSMRSGHSSEELIPIVYEELRRLALARLAHEAAGQT